MKTWVRKTLNVGALAAGVLLFAPGAAHADVASQSTGGNVGVLNGTQVYAPVSLPVNLTGNADAVGGFAYGVGQSGNVVESGNGRGWGPGDQVQQVSQGNFGIGNGSQVYLPFSVPVNMVGNGVSVLGFANAAGSGVNNVESGKAGRRCEGGGGCSGGDVVAQQSTGNFGILNGTQFYAPVSIPVNMCGNSLAVLALTQAQGQCVNRIESARKAGHKSEGNRNESGTPDVVAQTSSHNFGFLNGSQHATPINIPINVCGNSFALLGATSATGQCANNIGVRDCARPVNVTVVKGCNKPVHRPRPAAPVVSPDDDNQYAGDNDDDQYAGDNGADKYGDQGRDGKGESGGIEGIDGLTQSLSNAGGLSVAGLDVMDTLGK